MKLEEIQLIADPVRRLVAIMKTLRSPGGCPWDRKQTLESLTRYMREECAEVTDSVMEQDYPGVCDELGDLLMNIVFSCVVAEERQWFDFDAVATAATTKMIRRHPHVFGDGEAENAEQVVKVWDEIKKREKQHLAPAASVLDGIPRSHSALMLAEAVQKRVAKYGFDWPEERLVLDKIEEELGEIRQAYQDGDDAHIDEEIGDLLFAVVNLSRFRKRDMAEDLMLRSVKKFERRFRTVEKLLKAENLTLEQATLEQMDAAWERAKATE